MPAASAGNVLFSKLVAFKEATPGTIPTLTSGGRKLLVTPTGVISEGTTIELGTERSVALRNPQVSSLLQDWHNYGGGKRVVHLSPR